MAARTLPNNEMLNSEEDFGAAYKTYSRPIYHFFYWRTRDADLSEDLTSNVFENAWRNRGSFSNGSVKAWLYKIAHNLLIDHWRSKKELRLVDVDSIPAQTENLGQIMDKQLAAERLQAAVDGLPKLMRLVISLRFMQQLPVRQVAKILGISEGNVRIIQYRALKEVRKNLNER